MSKKLNPEDYLAIKDIMQEQLDVLEKQQAKAESINKVFKDLGTNLFGASNYQKQIVDDLENAKTIAEQEEVIQRRTVELLTTKKFLSSDIKKQILEQLDKRQLQINLEKQAVKVLEHQKELSDELASSVDGFIDGIEGKVKSIPVLGGFLAKTMGLEDLRNQFKENVADTFTEHFQESMKDGKGLSSSIMAGFKGMRAGVMGFGKSLLSAFAPLAPILITLTAIKAVFDFDKKVTELSRNLGISRGEAERMSASFNNIALTSSDLSITSKSLAEAQQQLSESTGMTTQFSEDMLKTQIKLTKFMGLSGQEAAKFQEISHASGMDARDLQLEVVGTVEQFNNATNAGVNLNDVMKDISNMSADMRANFNGNNVEMTKAVALARAMGTSLQDSANAAEKTLSIESSLKNEMTAMMLTGVRINNNAIRQAQLAGETEKVLELQKEQIASIDKSALDTPMKRKAIADAMGLEVDKLMEMKEAEEVRAALGVDLASATLDQINNSTSLSEDKKKELIAQREQMSMQEKMNALTTKLGEIFQQLAPPLLAIAEVFSSIIGFIGHMISGLMESKALLAVFALAAAPLAISLISSAVGAIFSTFAMIPLGLGIPLAIAAVGGMMSMIGSAKEVGDVMSPADGKTQVSTKEGGLFELSPNDDLMAAPGIFDAVGGVISNAFGGGGGTPAGIDLSGLINEIKGLRKDIQAQPIMINVDGRVVSEISRVQRQQDSVRTTGYGR